MRNRRPLQIGRRQRRRLPGPLLLIAVVVALLGVAVALGHGGLPAGPRAAHDPAIAARSPFAPENTLPRHHRTASQRERRELRAARHVMAYTSFVAAGTSRHRAIALTFDDGPSPYTPAMVRTLVRLRVPATFFIVGQQLRYFAAGLRDELRYGFVIGNHTQNHAWLIHLSRAGQYSQIHSDISAMRREGAPPPMLFRPPYGAYDGRTVAILHRLGMLMVLWSVDTNDWRQPGTKAIVHAALSGAHPGAIILMHDGGGDRSQTIAAVPAIVKQLRKRHYDLVTVPRLLALDPPPRRQRLPALTGG